MKVISTFPYNGEPIVELHLEYLADVVDEFVIVEARTTFSGVVKKELYMDRFREVFANAKYRDRVHLLVIDEFPPMPNDWPSLKGQEYMTPDSYESWFRENYQRDYVVEYIRNKYENKNNSNGETEPYVLIGVDADEIPKKEYVMELKKNYFAFNNPVYMQMAMFYYNFAWVKKYSWYHPYIVNDIGMAKVKYSLSDMRTRLPKTKLMQEAGWHASYFLTKRDLIRKIEGFAHRECDISHRKCDAFLDQCLESGLDISERGEEEQLIPYDRAHLPEVFRTFQDKLTFLQRYSALSSA